MFRNWVLQNFPYIEDDFDALTDYELFSKICGYVLEYSKDNEEMKKKIEDIEHYFDTLDVQEEINNKLDEMAEDGTLAEIINEEIFNGLNSKINFNKFHSLSDNVQANIKSDISLVNAFPSGYAISSIYIINNKGIAVANDWTESGSGGTKFDLITFDYYNGNIINITTREHLLNGHSNSMCKIDDNHVLIIAINYNYIYDIENYIITPIILPYSTFGCDYDNKIYCGTDYDWDNNTEVNKLYEISFDSNYDPTIVNERTIPNLREKLQGNEQGAVIYEGLLIFPSFSNCKLCIYDLESLTYLKTQLFTSPYIVEYEDGFVYNNELLLCDTLGNVYVPDIYGKNAIGGYNYNSLSKSLTDISLIDEPIKLTSGTSVTIKFEKFMTFMSDDTDVIGSMGKHLESLTIYGALKNFAESGGVHNIQPIEIPLYKHISITGETINWYAKHWSTKWEEFSDGDYSETIIAGDFDFGGGDSVPTLILSLDSEKLGIGVSGTTPTYIVDDSETFYLYITKIIGHRKVGIGY